MAPRNSVPSQGSGRGRGASTSIRSASQLQRVGQARARHGEPGARSGAATVTEEEQQPTLRVEEVSVPYFKPVVTMPDGKTVNCEHPYLHETREAAVACGRKMARAGEFVR